MCLSCHCVVSRHVSRLPKVFILNRAIRELVLTGVVIVSSRALRAAMLSGVRRLVYRYQAPLTRLPRINHELTLHMRYTPRTQLTNGSSRDPEKASELPPCAGKLAFSFPQKTPPMRRVAVEQGGQALPAAPPLPPRCRLNVTACVNTEVLPRAVSATPPSIVIVAPCAIMVRRFRALS